MIHESHLTYKIMMLKIPLNAVKIFERLVCTYIFVTLLLKILNSTNPCIIQINIEMFFRITFGELLTLKFESMPQFSKEF